MADSDALRTSIAAELGSLAEAARAVATPDAVTLPAGVVIGEHFVIEGVLGRGGMGVVYRARDRRLDRRVALKLDLRGADLARVQREATALARLAHPNVVTIYEVGEHDGAGFVAMELCTGGSVRAWLAATPRPWRAILDVFVAAGRGLAAAHAAGLVHRDIKPDNLLLGDDGRPRVADFGLARDAAGLTSPGGPVVGADATTVAGGGADPAHAATLPGPSRPSGDSDRLTETGAMVGTPRYMAPEQFAGGVVDARADQFAFAVALYEALAGVDPFPAALDARLAAMIAGQVAAPRRAVPRRLLRPLLRAMAAAPAARWPSLDALLRALAAGARPRWPWVAVAAGVVAALTATVLVTRATAAGMPLAAALHLDPPAPCAGLALDVDDRWGPTQRAALIAGNPAAPAAAALVAEHLDGLAADWRAARRTLCTELPTRATWSVQLERAGRLCLVNRGIELDRVAAWRGRSAGQLLGVIQTLPSPRSCASPAELSDAVLQPGEAAAEATVHQVDVAIEAGRLGDALTIAKAAVAALPGDAVPIVRGQLEYALGRAAIAVADFATAEPHLRTAFYALRAATSSMAFAVAVKMTELLSDGGKAELAAEWLGYARAEAARLDLELSNRAMLELLAARVADARGDHAAALAATTHGLAIIAACPRPACHLTALQLRSDQAIYLAAAGDATGSLAVAREVVAARAALHGDDSGELITDLFNIGLTELDLGQLDAGLATLARARAIAETQLPHDAPLYAFAIWNHALAIGRRDPRAARPEFDRALAIIERASGKDSADARELRADRAKWGRVR